MPRHCCGASGADYGGPGPRARDIDLGEGRRRRHYEKRRSGDDAHAGTMACASGVRLVRNGHGGGAAYFTFFIQLRIGSVTVRSAVSGENTSDMWLCPLT